MTPLSSPEKHPNKLPDADYPWPLKDNPLRKNAMVPKKLFAAAIEEKRVAEEGVKVTVRRDAMIFDQNPTSGN